MKPQTLVRKFSQSQLTIKAEKYGLKNAPAYSKMQLAKFLLEQQENQQEPLPFKGVINEEEIDAKELVLKQGILFKVDAHCWWGKTSKTKEGEINAPKDIMTGVKTLIDPVDLARPRFFRSYGERLIKRYSYPFLGLRGVYWVPKYFVSGLDADLKGVEKDFNEVVETEVIAKYSEHKKRWKKKAGKYYDESQYPSVAELRSKFKFSWIKFAITLPGVGSSILSEKEYKEELAKQKVIMKEFVDKTLSTLAEKFYKIIENLHSRLNSGDSIRPKTLESLNSFVETFKAMNVTNNAALANLVNDATKVIGSKDAKDFNEKGKAGESARKDVVKKIEKVVKTFKAESEKDSRLKRMLDF